MKRKILWISILITTIGIIFFWLASSTTYHDRIVKNKKQELKTYLALFDETYSINNSGAEALSVKLGGAHITFIEMDGDILGDSKGETTNIGSNYEVMQALENGAGYAKVSTNKIDRDMLYYCEMKDGILVRVGEYVFSSIGVLGESLSTLIWFLIFDLIVCFLFAIMATSAIISPVEELAKSTYFVKEVKTEYVELKPLADIINQRNRQIDNHIKTIEEEKDLVVQAQNSKNEFIANITHEMNTPLTSIKGFAELLTVSELPKEKQDKALNTILKQSERLSNLIACIINYNEIDGDFLPSYEVDASKIAFELIDSLEPTLNGVTLTMDIDDEVIIYSRYERIHEILNNIISNAIKYNKPNGNVHVALKGGPKPFLRVTDTGIGIAEKDLDKIFDRFFTVDKSHNGKNGGFGLGLAVVKKICRKAEWKLSVSSQINEGTTFEIKFY